MTEQWLSLDDAVELIRSARKVSVGGAIQFLIDACAGGVRARQRPLYEEYDWGPVIPAAEWRGAHLDLDTGELFPAGTDQFNPPTEYGGYGDGGSGIIEVAEDDLRDYLRKPAPRKLGRPPKVDEEVKKRIFKFLDHHGAPNPRNPKCATQAAVEKIIQDEADVSPSTARIHASEIIDNWKKQKAEKSR
jgi:hypothetical protein